MTVLYKKYRHAGKRQTKTFPVRRFPDDEFLVGTSLAAFKLN